MNKNKKNLLLKLKGELISQDINALENIIKEHSYKFNGINFDLTGLRFIDSSGIGFLINQYNLAKQNRKNVNFYLSDDKINVFTQNDILNLCERVLTNNQISEQQGDEKTRKYDTEHKNQPTEDDLIDKPDNKESIREKHVDNSSPTNEHKTIDEILDSDDVVLDSPEKNIDNNKNFKTNNSYSGAKEHEVLSQTNIHEENKIESPPEDNEKIIEPIKEPVITKKSITDPGYLKTPVVETPAKARPPLIEKYTKGDIPGKKSIYIHGVIISFLIILSLFLPQLIEGKIITSWHLLNSGIKAVPIIATILAGVIFLIISVIPGLNMYNRSPVFLLLGALGITMWFVFMNRDVTFHYTFSSILTYKKSLFYLTIIFIFTGTILKFISRNPDNRIALITLGILLFIIAFMYVYPFKEYKRIILTGLKSRVLLKGLVLGLKNSGFLAVLLRIYLLLPVLFIFVSIIIFIKPEKFLSLTNVVGTLFLYFIPFLLFIGMFYAGFKVKAVLFSHTAYFFIQLTLYSYIFNKGFLYTFFVNRMAGYYHIIPINYSGAGANLSNPGFKKKQYMAIHTQKTFQQRGYPAKHRIT